MVKNTRVPEGTEFETRGDRVAKRVAKKAYGDRNNAIREMYAAPDRTDPGDNILEKLANSSMVDSYDDLKKDQDLIKKQGGTKAMKSKSFATKRYMNGGMVMSGRGVRDTKMS
jgi:hypothetical protein